VKELAPVLADLQDFKETRKDDFALNQNLRKIFRTKKKELDQQKKDGEKIGLSIPLLPTIDEDRQLAKQIKFHNTTDLQLFEKKRKLTLKSTSIFGNTKDSPAVRNAKLQILAKRRKV
jgi:hypothetical protein